MSQRAHTVTPLTALAFSLRRAHGVQETTNLILQAIMARISRNPIRHFTLCKHRIEICSTHDSKEQGRIGTLKAKLVPIAELTDEEIIVRCKSGQLLDDIDGLHLGVDGDLSIDRCVALHNADKIDVLSLTKTTQFEALSGWGFFERQHFFCKAIPRLLAPMPSLMQAVRALVEKGGADLMANRPYEAFRDWCIANPARAHAIIAGAEAGDDDAVDFVTFAFTALADASLARSFVATHSDKRRLPALFALGRIRPVDANDAEASITALMPFIAAAYDEATRCNALISLLDLCEKVPELAPAYLPKAITKATVSPSSGLLFKLAQAIWMHAKFFNRSSVECLLDAFKSTDPTLSGIVHELDQAVVVLLQGENSDLALNFLTEIIARDVGFKIDQFKSVKNELAQGGRERLFQLLVRWLGTESLSLGEASQQLLLIGNKDVPFDATTAKLKINDADRILLAHRSLGWLFTNDVIAASILVACLRGCKRNTAKVIGELLFDPLLVNYGGKAQDYLRTIKKGDKAYGPVRAALKASTAFVQGLEIEIPIKELRPSQYQRSIERRHATDFMRKMHRDAEKQSVFLNLVRRSIVLYGRRSVTYIQEPGGERRPFSMDMHSVSHSFELPRGEIVDPVGISIMLYAFRSWKHS
jgi:hypothetical protein